MKNMQVIGERSSYLSQEAISDQLNTHDLVADSTLLYMHGLKESVTKEQENDIKFNENNPS